MSTVEIYKTCKFTYTIHKNQEGVVVGKDCIDCNKTLPLQAYRPHVGCYLNVSNYCRDCLKKKEFLKRRARGAKDPYPKLETREDGLVYRECTKCHLMKCLTVDFDKVHSGFMGHHSACRECEKRRNDLYRRGQGIKQKRDVNALRDESGVVTHRECTRCHDMLPLTIFAKHKKALFGVHPYCKFCSADRHLMNKYGITVKDKINIYMSQQGSCKVCMVKFPVQKLHVDHCHSSGVVRGLLCDCCNMALGMLGDGGETTIKNCKSMIRYCKANSLSDRHSKH